MENHRNAHRAGRRFRGRPPQCRRVSATAITRAGPRLWRRAVGKSALLARAGPQFLSERWSVKPDHKSYFYAPFHRPQQPIKNDPWSTAAIPTQFPIEGRDYKSPERTAKTIREAFPVLLLEALSPDHVAVVVRRELDSGSEPGKTADYGLRVWGAKDGAFLGDVFFPSRIHALRSSDDGRVIAALADREHVVYLWKFNPNESRSFQYSDPTGWDGHAPFEWTRLEKDGKTIRFGERRGGRWQYDAANLDEKARSAYAVVFRQDEDERRLYNNGLFWKGRTGGSDRHAVFPNFEGYPRDGLDPAGTIGWSSPLLGHWSVGDLAARRPPNVVLDDLKQDD